MKFLTVLQKGGALKFVFVPVIAIIFFILFINLEQSHSLLDKEDTISIPLQSYTLIKRKKAKTKISPEQIIEKGRGRQVAGTDDIEEAYLGKVQSIVNAQKRYPPYEMRTGAEDNVQIRILILPSGVIQKYEIIGKSKFGGFNEEVERMIDNALLPPFPQGLNKEHISLIFFVSFRMNDR